MGAGGPPSGLHGLQRIHRNAPRQGAAQRLRGPGRDRPGVRADDRRAVPAQRRGLTSARPPCRDRSERPDAPARAGARARADAAPRARGCACSAHRSEPAAVATDHEGARSATRGGPGRSATRRASPNLAGARDSVAFGSSSHSTSDTHSFSTSRAATSNLSTGCATSCCSTSSRSDTDGFTSCPADADGSTTSRDGPSGAGTSRSGAGRSRTHPRRSGVADATAATACFSVDDHRRSGHPDRGSRLPGVPVG